MLCLFFSACYVSMAQPFIAKSVTQMTCNNNDGAITITPSGGLAPYTYSWTSNVGPVFSTGASLSNLGSGIYHVIVTDSDGKSNYDSTILTNGMQTYLSSIPAVCPNNNGSVSVSVSGGAFPYTYAWSDGSNGTTVNNLAGNKVMQVEVEDVNGCKAYFINHGAYPAFQSTTGEITVGLTSPVNITFSSTPEECPLVNGTATAHAAGGTAPYTYFWSTTPAQTTQTISGLVANGYMVKATDANGCTVTSTTNVNLNAGSLNVVASVTDDYCSKLQGSATLTITGGVPPYTTLWPDGTSLTSKTGLGLGYYNVDVTDQNNCVFHKFIFVNDISPVYTYISATETGCTNMSGSASVSAYGGVAPYTYQWNTGATSAAISNLSKNYYAVLVTDVNGCKATNWTSVEIDNSCYANISGTIFQDNNGNCIQDATDYPIMNHRTYMNGASTSAYLYDGTGYTGNTGKYSMRYVLPDQYSIYFYDDVRTAACPVGRKYALNIPVSGVDYPNKDFAMQPHSLEEDTEVLYGSLMSDPRPGFNYSYSVAYENIGTLPSDGMIEIVYGDFDTFVSASPSPDSYDPINKTLQFNYSTLMLGEARSIQLTFKLPASTLLGSAYTHSITADIGSPDPTPWNNVIDFPFTVVGSFDPNEMIVSPKGNITEADSILSYTIRFQNTGTYKAELVIVKDTLEANLDISSISDITSSHAVKFKVLENGAVEFAFENINLPDSTRDEPNSHGFVSYRIKKKKHLAVGTEIKNKAEIYFDFNQPVVTNTTVNTIAIPTDVIEKTEVNSSKVYPNPAKNFTAFSFQREISFLQLMNSSGIVVMTEVIKKQKDFRLDFSFSKGMYFYRAVDADGNAYSGKLIIEE